MIQSNRYAVETKEGNFDLFITGIVEEDAGTYICQINSEPMQNIVSKKSFMVEVVGSNPGDRSYFSRSFLH